MPYLHEILALAVTLTVAMIALVVWRPAVIAGRAGRALAFVALFVLPVVLTALGVTAHLEQSKSTEFCLSCHVMEPYGQSLWVDDENYIPANHFQNNYIPRDRACYVCHTTYTMYGDVRAKLQGLKHVWVYYLGATPEEIELYQPYHNRECLSCHEGGRRFEADELHLEMRSELASGETSCLECHEPIHDVANLESLEMWKRANDG